MPITSILLARHAHRTDSESPLWYTTTATPYDPPLSEKGFVQAAALSQTVASEISKNVSAISSSSVRSCSAYRDNYCSCPTQHGPKTETGSEASEVASLDISNTSTYAETARETSPVAFSDAPSLSAWSSLSSTSSFGFSPSLSSHWLPSAPASKTIRVYIHTSPFLRCVQTAHAIAAELQSSASAFASPFVSYAVQTRMDAFLGEWLTPDYFSAGVPPDDGHRSLRESSVSWLLSQGGTASKLLDTSWPLNKFGNSGEYGERWRSMNMRLNLGFNKAVQYYESEEDDTVVVFVTHGAGCNSLLGALARKPILQEVGLASLSIAVPHRGKWELVRMADRDCERDQSMDEAGLHDDDDMYDIEPVHE